MDRSSDSMQPVDGEPREPTPAPPLRRPSWWARIPAKVKTLGGAALVLASVAGVTWNARGRVSDYATKADVIGTANAATAALAPVQAEVHRLRERISVAEAEAALTREWKASVNKKLDDILLLLYQRP